MRRSYSNCLPRPVAEDAGLEQSASAQGRAAVSTRRRARAPRRRDRGDENDPSALTGTNLRLILTNLGIKTVVCCGIFTDRCVSSTVRSLADESFGVVVVEDCCAAGSDELHHRELEIINMIYCQVMSSAELKQIMGLGPK
jgi:nicotinamidase-related amidase